MGAERGGDLLAVGVVASRGWQLVKIVVARWQLSAGPSLQLKATITLERWSRVRGKAYRT